MDSDVLTEVPSTLKRLARMIVRGFYNTEHVIIIDMLVRNPCMKEDDLVELLKFERKQLRSCITQLKNDKFIKIRLKMETGPDGKATRQNYYFINYKVFVNVVKYKLDHMRRKIETEERDSTSRASFKCPICLKSFTDLEVNLLFSPDTNDFHCTFCNSVVEEDESSLPKQDSRLLLAKFNEQVKPMYALLRDVEDIKLAPEILEPEPTDLSYLKRDSKPKSSYDNKSAEKQGTWSGDNTRHRDFKYEQDVTISFGDNNQTPAASQPKKERPVWMVESTVMETAKPELPSWAGSTSFKEEHLSSRNQEQENIMQVLLAHEKKSAAAAASASIPKQNSDNESDTSESEDEAKAPKNINLQESVAPAVEEMDEDDDDDEEGPMVTIGHVQVPLHAVTDDLINKMTPVEKENYIKISQEMYASMYE